MACHLKGKTIQQLKAAHGLAGDKGLRLTIPPKPAQKPEPPQPAPDHLAVMWKRYAAAEIPAEAVAYLEKRAVDGGLPYLREKGRIGYDAKHKSLAFPMHNAAGELVGLQRIPIDGGQKLCVRGSNMRDGFFFLPGTEPGVVATESIIDALSVRLCSEKTVVAVMSASTTDKAKALGQNVILFLDRDEAGDNATKKILEAIPTATAVNWRMAPGGCKDPNDLFRGGYGEVISKMIAGATRQAAGGPGKEDQAQIRLMSFGEIAKSNAEVDPLFAGLLNRGESLVVAAAGGVSKSLLTTHMALTGALAPFAGLWGKFAIQRPLRSLFLQSENGLPGQAARLRRLFAARPEFEAAGEMVRMAATGNDPRVFGDLADVSFQKTILGLCDEFAPDLLYIDPLISYHRQDENENVSMRATLDHLTRLCEQADVAVVLVHHFNRMGQIRGAASIRDWACNVLLLELAERREDETVILKAIHDKSRNYPLRPDFFLERTPDLDFRICEKPGSRQADQVQAAVDALQALGGRVDSQTALVSEIVATQGCARETARKMIKSACKSRAILGLSPTKTGCSMGYCLPN